MNNLASNVATLSPQQRAVLELKLQARRQNGGRAPAVVESNDEENRVLTESQDSVDGLLAKFYRRFPWPWQPIKFDYLEDADFGINMLNQDLGDFSHRTVPRNAKIWVAGCGTNQALHTALKFPNASVVGSDLSSKSLELCAMPWTTAPPSLSANSTPSPTIRWSSQKKGTCSVAAIFMDNH